MKNKTKTYLLLVAVLAIWGFIGFKIVSSLNPEPPKVNVAETMASFAPNINTSQEKFSIQLPERDPFLGKMYIKKTDVKPKPVVYKQPMEWLPITYHGLISKPDTKDKICIVSINGYQRIMKVGQNIEGVKLLKATTNEINVSYKGLKKTINKA